MKIAAVFASFNRCEVAVECVKRLRAQTRPLELVVVGDNASSDGSVEALCDLGWEALKIIDTGGNLGNAGAVRLAMERAFDEGIDAVWILDDDSWPRPGALEALTEGDWDPRVVRHALQVDPESGGFTWPMWFRGGDRWELASKESDLPDGSFLASRASWTGALISREVREKVGPVNGELFIRGEDEEYPWRIGQAGFSFEAVRAAVLDHPGAKGLVHWSVFGKHLFFERGLVDWKLYYKVRNMVWLKKQQSGPIGAMAMALAYTLATLWVDGMARLPLIRTAVADGWFGRLGQWSTAE
jgi:GT2 family glycosyltransferase